MDNRNHLSFRALLRHDAYIFFGYMLPLAMSIIILPAAMIPGPPTAFSLGLLVAILAIGALVLVARVGFVRSVYRKSEIVKGKIDDLEFIGRGWVRITYSYTLAGQRYSTSNRVVKNEITTSFFPRKEVLVAVNPQKPRQAFVVELYQG
ncbi:MAG: hypothetical protein JW987_12450 [Anaerolineaceae bacterium]|nr:hypothetical protein [Anaerolineaceae bacterium]